MNPYIRAAKKYPELKEKAITALQNRQQEAPQLVRARDENGRFIADDPNTPEDEAWVSAESK